ncbi:transmembrane emp24 domain-containing protein 7 [Elysia marginata]|uniref:Transmembrane emp24 domain-containing protein 7 n=1 Tax=Elysia marginata TaxID=1093978 RepID=A0AAV4HTJ1_9GAST|nr:transmembrane emp24 domain-containing protein 7 [Elysia marginata]
MHKSCFSKTFTASVQVVFEFKVVSGGNRDIDIKVISPNGLVLFKALRTSGDEISFYAYGGDFRFCFSNEFSKVTGKRVAFNIRPFDEAEPVVASVNETIVIVKGPMEAHCENIHFLLGVVQDFQAKYMVRESAGRYLAETLQARVDTYSLGLSLAVLVAGLGQVAVFKMFFTERRTSSKPAPQDTQL